MYKKIFISTSVQLMSYLLYRKYQQSEFRVLAYSYCLIDPIANMHKMGSVLAYSYCLICHVHSIYKLSSRC